IAIRPVFYLGARPGILDARASPESARRSPPMLAHAGRNRGLPAPSPRVYPAATCSGRSRTRRAALRAAAPALALTALAACSATPVPRRQAFNVMSVEDDQALGAKAYEETLAGAKLADNHLQAPMLHEVVHPLVQAAH